MRSSASAAVRVSDAGTAVGVRAVVEVLAAREVVAEVAIANDRFGAAA